MKAYIGKQSIKQMKRDPFTYVRTACYLTAIGLFVWAWFFRLRPAIEALTK